MSRRIQDIFTLSRWRYLLSGITRRTSQPRSCPVCGSANGSCVGQKFFHSLWNCEACSILYRYPGDSGNEMVEFYQEDYCEPSLTTDMPSESEIEGPGDVDFSGSGKDFSYHISILKALGLKEGSRLLDYGANWGYATYQFRKAGFDTDAFEISKPRAKVGEKLGIEINSDPEKIGNGYDAVYSSHVLEHVENPRRTIEQMLGWVRPGGMVVAHTPNGSLEVRDRNPQKFSQIWGEVHPVLLTKEFVERNFSDYAYYVSSDDRPEAVSGWDRKSSMSGPMEDSGLFFAIVRSEDHS